MSDSVGVQLLAVLGVSQVPHVQTGQDLRENIVSFIQRFNVPVWLQGGRLTQTVCVFLAPATPSGVPRKPHALHWAIGQRKKIKIVIFYGPHGKWRRCHKTNRSLYARAGKKGNIDIHVVGISPISTETFFSQILCSRSFLSAQLIQIAQLKLSCSGRYVLEQKKIPPYFCRSNRLSKIFFLFPSFSREEG